jgi:hypothetical protein
LKQLARTSFFFLFFFLKGETGMASSFKEKSFITKLTRFSRDFLQFIVVWVNFGFVDHILHLPVLKNSLHPCAFSAGHQADNPKRHPPQAHQVASEMLA